jgi:FKBP-type peptidyl-prolyl cis-trans isomerase SlyD
MSLFANLDGWVALGLNSLPVKIEKNKVVTFHYSLTAEGDYAESSRGGDPASYLHGYGGIVRGLERAMRGHQAGDNFTVEVAPEDAFGERNPQIVQRVPRKRLIGASAKLAPGQVVAINTQQGRAQGVALKVGRFNVDVDFNHPMAGRGLRFEVDILDVREASPEEIAHRHAHGPSGAHHCAPQGVASDAADLG